MKLVLKEPVQVGKEGAPVTELTFREKVCAGDMRGIKIGSLVDLRDAPTEDVLKIAGRLCGQVDEVMNGLSFADLGEVVALVVGFLRPGPETGKTA